MRYKLFTHKTASELWRNILNRDLGRHAIHVSGPRSSTVGLTVLPSKIRRAEYLVDALIKQNGGGVRYATFSYDIGHLRTHRESTISFKLSK